MLKRILPLLLAVALIAVLIPTAALGDAGDYYVYTENGEPLNVREKPNGTIVGSIRSGEKVYVYSFVNAAWARVTFHYAKGGVEGDYDAYINRRYLTRTLPEDQPAAAVTAPIEVDTLTDLNRIFKTARAVEPYQVTLRPSRVTGWVSMRWAPYESAALLATYKANDQLTVLKELDGWLQVQDPATGNVGFVNIAYIAE